MPLTLVATPGAVDANAYATVAQADALAAYRGALGAAFLALTPDQRITALVTTAADIDSIGDDFIGARASSTQSMEWPRSGTEDYADNTLPAKLVRANIEYAIISNAVFATGGSGELLSATIGNGNVKSKTVDVLTTEYFEPTAVEASSLDRFPRVVQNLLRSLVYAASDTEWGSAAVTRGS